MGTSEKSAAQGRTTLAILAGGRSGRMGRDKSLLPFLGKPLVLRVVERLRSLTEDVILTTDRPADYAFLGVRCVPDLEPGRGALGGLYTSLKAAGTPLVAVTACDMPFASLRLFETERDLLLQTGADVVIPETEHGLEPLHAVYRRETCLPSVEAALNAGEWKLIAWLPRVAVYKLPGDVISEFDPLGLAFWNLNTPQDFHQAEERARKLDTF